MNYLLFRKKMAEAGTELTPQEAKYTLEKAEQFINYVIKYKEIYFENYCDLIYGHNDKLLEIRNKLSEDGIEITLEELKLLIELIIYAN